MPTAQREPARAAGSAAGPTPCLIAYSVKLFALFSNENHFALFVYVRMFPKVHAF